tara:strand:- start:1121 stop:1918 length:798 start_codon:yes stop_codon:yes gene_type:complete
MVEVLGFESVADAEAVLGAYLPRAGGAELRALQLAEREGQFPEGVQWLGDPGLSWLEGAEPIERFGRYLEAHIDIKGTLPSAPAAFRAFLSRCAQKDSAMGGVSGDLKLILLSDLPRGFTFRAIERLGLAPYFEDSISRLLPRRVFATENLLPHVAAQREALEIALAKSVTDPAETLAIDGRRLSPHLDHCLPRHTFLHHFLSPPILRTCRRPCSRPRFPHASPQFILRFDEQDLDATRRQGGRDAHAPHRRSVSHRKRPTDARG